MPSENAQKIVSLIIKDMTDRRGLRQGWDDIDSDIQDEIRETWAKLIDTELVQQRNIQ